jgi:beta-lactamase class D
MSSQILEKRKGHYEVLEKTLVGSSDITPWLGWFLGWLDRAIIEQEEAGERNTSCRLIRRIVEEQT